MHAKRFADGFTLVELVVVVLILGILAGIAAPRLFGASDDAAVQAVVEDFKAFTLAVELYFHETGDFPPTAAMGKLPTELEDAFAVDFFASETAVGGRYVWINGPLGPSINIARVSPDRDAWRAIDAQLDDGDLSSGAMREDTNAALPRLRWFFTR